MPEALKRSIPGWLRPICTLVVLVCIVSSPAGAGEATSQNFRLLGQTSLMAAGDAQSTGFRLQSCIDSSPSGISSSTSFKLTGGCMPLTVAAAAESNPTDSTGLLEPVPLFNSWQIALLIFVLALLAWPSLVGRRTI